MNLLSTLSALFKRITALVFTIPFPDRFRVGDLWADSIGGLYYVTPSAYPGCVTLRNTEYGYLLTCMDTDMFWLHTLRRLAWGGNT